MPAFRAYSGQYRFEGRIYAWRCHATARVHEVRWARHADPNSPPPGWRWARSQHASELGFAWLVDAGVGEFSHMLSHVEPSAPPQLSGQAVALELQPAAASPAAADAPTAVSVP